MSDLYSQIMNNRRGALERIVSRIPGFGGYLDRAARRTADRLLRDHIAGQVDRLIKRVATAERRLLDNGGMMHMSATQSAKAAMQLYHDRLKGAAPGYSGFFEAIRIDAEELDLLYGFDELQMAHVDRLEAAVDAFAEAAQSGDGVAEAIRALEDTAREANDAFQQREDQLLNIQLSQR